MVQLTPTLEPAERSLLLAMCRPTAFQLKPINPALWPRPLCEEVAPPEEETIPEADERESLHFMYWDARLESKRALLHAKTLRGLLNLPVIKADRALWHRLRGQFALAVESSEAAYQTSCSLIDFVFAA